MFPGLKRVPVWPSRNPTSDLETGVGGSRGLRETPGSFPESVLKVPEREGVWGGDEVWKPVSFLFERGPLPLRDRSEDDELL